jgi:hypothetical protein
LIARRSGSLCAVLFSLLIGPNRYSNPTPMRGYRNLR